MNIINNLIKMYSDSGVVFRHFLFWYKCLKLEFTLKKKEAGEKKNPTPASSFDFFKLFIFDIKLL